MNPNDKRFVKNEKLMRDTFMQMLTEKRYAEITVNELCERAYISKNAFYYHHTNMDDLLKSIMNELFEDMIKIFGDSIYFEDGPTSEGEPFDIKATFDYFGDMADFFYPFFLRDDEIGFTSRIVFALKKAMFSKINLDKSKNMDLIMLTDYVLFGSLSFVKSWILNKEYINKEDAMKLYKNIHKTTATKLLEIGTRIHSLQ